MRRAKGPEVGQEFTTVFVGSQYEYFEVVARCLTKPAQVVKQENWRARPGGFVRYE
jgi:hypothetical protein